MFFPKRTSIHKRLGRTGVKGYVELNDVPSLWILNGPYVFSSKGKKPSWCPFLNFIHPRLVSDRLGGLSSLRVFLSKI